ncbi:MAG TPA: NAD(P)H-dependent oxidoreductase [Chloroflexota bacterium]|jgi:NAD(P)H-dependent FMN reductase
MMRIGNIPGSTRPNCVGEQVARWVLDASSRRRDAEFELIDLRDYPLRHLDEPLPAVRSCEYQHAHTRAWSSEIDSFDGFVIVTAEYNHSVPGVLKDTLDYLYEEWNHKVVGLVSYSSVGGARAAEHLRLVCGALEMVVVPRQLALLLLTDFQNFTTFTPGSYSLAALDSLLDQIVAWGATLAALRATHRAAAA